MATSMLLGCKLFCDNPMLLLPPANLAIPLLPPAGLRAWQALTDKHQAGIAGSNMSGVRMAPAMRGLGCEFCFTLGKSSSVNRRRPTVG